MQLPCIEFKPVTYDDIPDIVSYLKLANYEESNHNIVNLIMWKEYFPLWISRKENYICLIGMHLNEWFMYMPLCIPEYFDEAINYMYNCFKKSGVPVIMSCFTENEALRVKELYKGIKVIEDRDGFDYVYETERLRDFKGKKLQKKRNHLNSFYKEHDFIYEDISFDNVDECLEFLDEWNSKSEDVMASQEKEGSKEILRLWGKIPCNGGLIRINGKVEALIVGSHSSIEMGQINIEKANPEIRGCYQAILKEYIQRHLKSTRLLNREDDMGLESLRHAKQAYSPCMMIKKYRLVEEV